MKRVIIRDMGGVQALNIPRTLFCLGGLWIGTEFFFIYQSCSLFEHHHGRYHFFSILYEGRSKALAERRSCVLDSLYGVLFLGRYYNTKLILIPTRAVAFPHTLTYSLFGEPKQISLQTHCLTRARCAATHTFSLQPTARNGRRKKVRERRICACKDDEKYG